MTTQPSLKIIVILTGLFLSSCDPTYPILISNNTTDTVTIIAETTIHFHTDDQLIDFKELGGPYDHKSIRFKIAPKTTVKCGMAIADIQDEIPFTKFSLYANKDSIFARTQDEIIGLFQKTSEGDLKTPYQININ